MNVVWSRVLRSVYRKEPVVSFVVTIGAVDAAIGGLNERWSLMALGLGMVGSALILRWWQAQRQLSIEPVENAPVHILPPHRSSLAVLSLPKKHPPKRF